MEIYFTNETDGDPELDAVRHDTVEGLRDWFSPVGGDESSSWAFRSDLVSGGPLTNGAVTAVAWRYEAEPNPEVWGVAAERGPIFVDGVSFVGIDDSEGRSFSRYIDWHSAFNQLGVAAAGHVVQDTRSADNVD